MDAFRNKLLCGDVLTLMRTLPQSCVDLIITSPPYNIRNSVGNGLKSFCGRDKWKNAALKKGYAGYEDCLPHGQYVQWQKSCLTEMLRVLKDDGAIFYNHKWRVQNGLLQDRHDIVADFPVRQIIIWKRKGGINFNRTYFLPTYEVIYLIAKQAFKLAPKANAVGDVWEFTQERNNPHPAAFPLALSDRIVQSTEAQWILDPFMGSGTTALSAFRYGRDFMGIDRSPEYVAMASHRIEKYRTEATSVRCAA